MRLTETEIEQLRNSLRQAVIDCSERCLYSTSKWTAEMLHALPEEGEDRMPSALSTTALPIHSPQSHLEVRELPKYLMAKSLFHCDEFLRCAAVFLPASSKLSALSLQSNKGEMLTFRRTGISQKGLFLCLYALMIAGEKQVTEERGSILGLTDVSDKANPNLVSIKRVLENWFNTEREQGDEPQHNSQGWLEYLYGMILAKERTRDLAVSWLLKSVAINPWNWGAWQELASLIRDVSHLRRVLHHITPTVMGFIFSVYCRQELRHVSTSLILEISQLEDIFPRSAFLKMQRASALYSIRDIHAANSLFWRTIQADPRRLDMLDYYSNVLFTLGSRERMALVAQLCSAVDQHRPETCCVIGNYHSLCNRHEDAVASFRQALILDRNFSSAWTLLGHEFLQLQNTHAAIECYRRAIYITEQDYRSFVGLGQCYELLDKPTFALHYYRRAANLRPHDPDLWEILANCLSGMSKLPQAAKAFEIAILRTSQLENPSSLARKHIELLYRLANVYEKTKGREEAAALLDLCLEKYAAFHDRNDDDSAGDPESGPITLNHVRILLAQWAVDDGDLDKAERVAKQVEDGGQFEGEARRILELCAM